MHPTPTPTPCPNPTPTPTVPTPTPTVPHPAPTPTLPATPTPPPAPSHPPFCAPLAVPGELSPAIAWSLCLTLAGTGLSVVACNFGTLITSLYALGLFLGTVYSIPPLRLKQYAVPAFMIIATVRGFLLNFGVYYATRAALALPFEWSPAIRWAGGRA